MIAFGLIVFAVLLFTGVPIFIAFALGGLIILNLHTGLPLYNVGIFFFDSIDNWIMLAVPLFMLGGQLMAESGIGKSLVDFMGGFFGRIPGSLAITAIGTSGICGAMVGSNLAVLGSIGVVLYPAMIKAGYDRSYSAGVLCSSSQVGFLIPPSIVFIIFGFLTQTSVAQLFISGIMPGILLCLMLAVLAIVIAQKRGFPRTVSSAGKEQKKKWLKALPSIFMPVIVLGGIYGGIFTPTEAAGVACVYALIIGAFVYRQLTWKKVMEAAVESARLTGIILILLCAVMLLSRSLNIIGVPQAIGRWVTEKGLNPMIFLVLFSLALIVLGMIVDAVGLVAIIPVILPAAHALNISMIQLGVIFVVASMIGTMTPPAAAAIYFTSALYKLPTAETIRGIIPFLVATILALFVFIFFPFLSTWLPSTMF